MVCSLLHQIGSELLVRHLTRHSSLSLLARMTHKKEHLDLTSDQFRDPGATPAQVTRISTISPTVKSLTLQVDEKASKSISFQPGQWLDFFIPGEEKVGGFSMCSSPSDLSSKGTVELAVKFSTWAPAHWVHTKCEVGSDVTFRFGGDFFYPSSGLLTTAHSLLLIGGGVGINPLRSIWLQAAELSRNKSAGKPNGVSLLYSAGSQDELLFREDFDKELAAVEGFRSKYFLTRTAGGRLPLTGRLKKEDLRDELQKLEGRTLCYLCGPPDMVDSVRKILEELGVGKEDIKFELWW